MSDGDIAAQRKLLAALIERFVSFRLGRGRYGMEIAWTLLGEGLQAAVLGSAHDERSAE